MLGSLGPYDPYDRCEICARPFRVEIDGYDFGLVYRREDLRAFILSRNWEYGMSDLGGMINTRGHIYGRERPVTDDVRQSLVWWAKPSAFGV
jgi:hypothetical protein